MNQQQNVMNLIDELRFRADKTLAYLEQMHDAGNTEEFDKDINSFYSWLTKNLRPELFSLITYGEAFDKE